MASIARRRDGKWRARYRDEAGKEHARHFDRKVDAQRWLDVVTASVVRGDYIDPARAKVTLRAYADRWLEAQPIRPTSRRTYEIHLRRRVLPLLGDKPLGGITPTDIRGLVKRLQAELAPNTVQSIHGLIANVLGSAVEDGHIPRNPAAKTSPRKPTRIQVKPLTVTQVLAIEAAMPKRYQAMVTVAAGCGLRLGEVLGLAVDRVRFLQRELDVDQQLVLIPGRPPYLAAPKTRSSVRTVALPEVVADALAGHLAAFPVTGEWPLVFRSRVDGPIWPNSFRSSVWVPAVTRAGVPGVRFHDLRHFYASALIAAGESVKTVQAAMGHSSAVETLETYAGLWPDAQDRTRSAVDALFAAADSLRTGDAFQAPDQRFYRPGV